MTPNGVRTNSVTPVPPAGHRQNPTTAAVAAVAVRIDRTTSRPFAAPAARAA